MLWYCKHISFSAARLLLLLFSQRRGLSILRRLVALRRVITGEFSTFSDRTNYRHCQLVSSTCDHCRSPIIIIIIIIAIIIVIFISFLFILNITLLVVVVVTPIYLALSTITTLQVIPTATLITSTPPGVT